MKRGLSTILVVLALSATVGAAAPPASAATKPGPRIQQGEPPGDQVCRRVRRDILDRP
jgi:hypothetical protein